MINIDELGAKIIFGIGDGSIYITESTIYAVIIAVILSVLGIWLGSGLQTVPKGKQVVAEFIVEWVYNFTKKNMGEDKVGYAPYVGTMFAFIFMASSLGTFGIRPITADLNVAFALSGLTFLMIQVNSIRTRGLKGKLHEMCDPYPFMFPMKIIEEFTLPVSLGLRLFGNIFGGFIVIELWMVFVTWLSSLITTVPFLRAITVLPLNVIFDVLEPALQTYIFTTLTVINLSAAVVSLSASESMK